MSNNKPVTTFQVGSIRAAVWENQNGDNTFHSITLSKRYKKDDEWKEGASFNHGDLLNVAKVCERAENFIADL